jgi:uncharacterized protein YdaU (DUF1376 family)
MAALPYIQLYVADYLADTAHLNAAQHGAYLLLIMNYWQRGKPLDNRNERLTNVARMSNEEWQQNKDSIAEFFEIDGDIWTHRRIEADLANVAAKQSKTSEAGKASAAAKKAKKTDVEQTFNERSTDVEQTFNHKEADVDTDIKDPLSSAGRAEEIEPPAQPTRKGSVCGMLRKAGMSDAAPHYLADEVWETILSKRTNEEIVEVARAKMAAMPNQRIGLKYIAKALMDDPQPIVANARASPGRRQTLTETRANTIAALTGRSQNERTTPAEHDITGESQRIA